MLKMGKSLLALITMVLFIIIPVSIAEAHSVLVNSTPADGEQLEETIKSIELTFNTKIEEGSTLNVVNNKGKKLQPPSVEITDDVLKATFQDSLKPGSYQVNWEIVGADGHPIENQYSFTIKETETTQSENNNDTQTKDDQTNSSKKDKEEKSEQSNQDEEQQNSSEQEISNDNEQSFLGSGIIIVLIIVGLVLLAWMLFSKRRS